MLKPNALRKVIVDFIEQNEGRARVKEIHAAIIAAGLKIHKSGISRCIQPLVNAGIIEHAGHGIYYSPSVCENTSERVYRRLPFETKVDGEILRYMLTHRFVRVSEVVTHLREAKIVRSRSIIYNAFCRLAKDGYVRRLSKGIYTVAEKSLKLAAVPDILDEPKAFDEPISQRLKPLILELLSVRGAMRQCEIIRYFERRDKAVQRWHVHAAMRQLRSRGIVEKMQDESYACVKKSDS